MLDTDTKRRIDSCRDILVGKVPDPKSQVEQITIALIYKFMDDMDAEAEELGGKRSFFAGDFDKYGWAKLMRSGLGGHETLNLYAEAIAKMPENPGIPALFRDIFKNAYLPYRDPETLRSFLKEIDGFTYDHSERLGDAFEYLLSVLGSQGEAGQFRTPRHIIDFMVEIIDPKKNESILDPACGTAGFLISSYKHILKHNTKGYREQQDREAYDEKGVPIESLILDSPLHYKGDLLTPDDRKRLAANIHGYDISPDMVRLSLVNLYLHGFTDPHIVEYDTLTSEEKWNETADVILANPPFMSPKGGIKPHKRFSILATRSEVLFVDYMAEHLSPQGRAAIIVPEGIIFQSGSAYKQLREMLVKTSLVAVVSLPAGVFNPYSGVKTSILILDKRLAKNTDSVLFVKIENDGYNLGAQRRAVTGSGLPDSVTAYQAFRHSRESGNPEAFDSAQFTNAHVVEKIRIGENGEWNLSGDRYREGLVVTASFPLVLLGDVCDVSKGSPITRDQVIEGSIPVIAGGQKPSCFHNASNRTGETITVSASGAYAGFVAYFEEPIFASDCSTIKPSDQRLLTKFLFHLLKSKQSDIYALQVGMGQPHVYSKDLEKLQIPLPPLAIQQEIVAEIDGYQKIIDGARQVIESYQPRITVQPDWPLKPLSDVCEHITDGDHQPPPKSDKGVPFVTITNINVSNELTFDKTFYVPESYYEKLSLIKRPQRGDVLYTVTGSFGIPVLINFDRRFCFQRHIALLRPSTQIISEFLYCLLASASVAQQAEKAATGVAQKTVALGSLRNFIVPVPPLDTQRAIVAEIEAEQALVNANKQLITRFEAKIKTTINRVWGELGAASSSRTEQPEEPVDQAGSPSTAPCAMSLAS